MSAPERITYLARRHPSFADRAAWIPRWRAHWALAAAQPESSTVRRYAQCEVILDAGEPPHDAVAFAEYVSPEERRRNRSAAGYHAIMRADEIEVFDRPIADCSFLGTHHVFAGEERGAVKVVRFLRRGAGGPTPEAWAEQAAASRGLVGAALGYAQTRALPPPPGGWGLAVDGCEEFRVDSLAAARRLLVPSAPGPFAVVAAVATTEVVLKDDAAPADPGRAASSRDRAR